MFNRLIESIMDEEGEWGGNAAFKQKYKYKYCLIT